MQLEGKVAMVTGAGSGIGRATAVRFGAEGARVACLDRDLASVRETVAELRAASVETAAIEADVASWSSMSAAADAVLEALGTIHVAVANAGVSLAGTAETTEVDDWNHVLSVNLTGVWLTARCVLPTMRTNGGGAIVNIASASALVGMRAVAGYSAAKAGVVGLTRQMAADYARHNIRVNAIAPGITATPMVESVFGAVQQLSGGGRSIEERLREAARSYPLGRLGRPDDIAQAACFLASDQASWITGTVMPVDGGFTAV